MLGSSVLRQSGVVLILLFAGCGGNSEPDLNAVDGKVTLDGKPLAGAIVSFIPETGPPSGAITDNEGNYVLKFKSGASGAVVGTHSVTISTDMDGSNQPGNEKVPEKYNKATTLSVVVKEGENSHDFPLVSQ